mmetsp:Transcript_4375/g.7517  ORF Transcript_4375/g.7517 Transcript_4375/m.7517 type:complete len:420 (+) Transcript_4375:157-1416(+)
MTSSVSDTTCASSSCTTAVGAMSAIGCATESPQEPASSVNTRLSSSTNPSTQSLGPDSHSEPATKCTETYSPNRWHILSTLFQEKCLQSSISRHASWHALALSEFTTRPLGSVNLTLPGKMHVDNLLNCFGGPLLTCPVLSSSSSSSTGSARDALGSKSLMGTSCSIVATAGTGACCQMPVHHDAIPTAMLCRKVHNERIHSTTYHITSTNKTVSTGPPTSAAGRAHLARSLPMCSASISSTLLYKRRNRAAAVCIVSRPILLNMTIAITVLAIQPMRDHAPCVLITHIIKKTIQNDVRATSCGVIVRDIPRELTGSPRTTRTKSGRVQLDAASWPPTGTSHTQFSPTARLAACTDVKLSNLLRPSQWRETASGTPSKASALTLETYQGMLQRSPPVRSCCTSSLSLTQRPSAARSRTC